VWLHRLRQELQRSSVIWANLREDYLCSYLNDDLYMKWCSPWVFNIGAGFKPDSTELAIKYTYLVKIYLWNQFRVNYCSLQTAFVFVKLPNIDSYSISNSLDWIFFLVQRTAEVRLCGALKLSYFNIKMGWRTLKEIIKMVIWNRVQHLKPFSDYIRKKIHFSVLVTHL